MIESFTLKDGQVQTRLSLEDIARAKDDPETLWINLRTPQDDEITSILHDVFGFHPLTIEEVRQFSKIPQVHFIDGTAFVVLLSPKTTVPHRGELFMRDLELYIRPDLLITSHRQDLQATQRLRDLLSGEQGQAVLKSGSQAMLLLLLKTIVERYQLAVEAVEDRCEELERLVRKTTRQQLGVFDEILDLKLSCQALRAVVEHTRACLTQLRTQTPLLSSEADSVEAKSLDNRLSHALTQLELAIQGLNDASQLFEAVQRRSIYYLLVTLIIVQGFFLFFFAVALIFGVPGR